MKELKANVTEYPARGRPREGEAEGTEAFLRQVEERHPHEPEFHDAVREFMETVYREAAGREDLEREAILERMGEREIGYLYGSTSACKMNRGPS